MSSAAKLLSLLRHGNSAQAVVEQMMQSEIHCPQRGIFNDVLPVDVCTGSGRPAPLGGLSKPGSRTVALPMPSPRRFATMATSSSYISIRC
jgi:hypothetical protein